RHREVAEPELSQSHRGLLVPRRRSQAPSAHNLQVSAHNLQVSAHNLQVSAHNLQYCLPMAAEGALLEKRTHLVEKRTHLVEERDHLVEERDHLTEERDHLAEKRTHLVEERDHLVEERDHLAEERDHLAEKRTHLVVSRLCWGSMDLPGSTEGLRRTLSRDNKRQASIREWLTTTVDKEDAKQEAASEPAGPFWRSPSGEDDLALGVEASVYGRQGVKTVQEFLRSEQKGSGLREMEGGMSTRSSPSFSRWNSFNSVGTGPIAHLSMMDVLNMWKDDPEEVLLDLGFGCDVPDISGRIPARFINAPSQARGINIQVFLEAQKNRLDLENPDVSRDKKAPGMNRAMGLTPLVEEQAPQGAPGIPGAPEQHFPQSVVVFQEQEGTARLEPLKEDQPLETPSMTQRKTSPGRARESFEMEEVHSFDEGSVLSGYNGGPENTVQGIMRTNSTQSDSSGFLEEPFIPSLPPGPDLLKTLSGMSGGSTESSPETSLPSVTTVDQKRGPRSVSSLPLYVFALARVGGNHAVHHTYVSHPFVSHPYVSHPHANLTHYLHLVSVRLKTDNLAGSSECSSLRHYGGAVEDRREQATQRPDKVLGPSGVVTLTHRPSGPIAIGSLGEVFETSLDGSQCDSEYGDVDAICLELDSDGFVYWAEPIRVSSTSPALSQSEGCRGGNPAPPDCPIDLDSSSPSPDKAIRSLSSSSPEISSVRNGSPVGVETAPSPSSPSLLDQRGHRNGKRCGSVSVQMPSFTRSVSHIIKRKDVPLVISKPNPMSASLPCLDTSTPLRAVQSWTDLQLQRKGLSGTWWGGSRGSLRGHLNAEMPLSPATVFSSDPTFRTVSNSRWSTDSLPESAVSFRSNSVSLDTGLWPEDEDEDSDTRVGRGKDRLEERLWEDSQANHKVCCCSCDRRHTCAQTHNRQPSEHSPPYSLDELQGMMCCLKKFRVVLADIEEQVSLDQAKVFNILSEADREDVCDITILRAAVKQEAGELELQLNQLAHHYDDNFKMKMHTLLNEQSLLCSQLKLLPPHEATPPAVSQLRADLCASRDALEAESPPSPESLATDSPTLGCSTTKPDKLDFIGFLQRLKESLRPSVNLESLE
ncbi:hypothetical protein NHX12_021479, partial [Muraenolepis orangiensis]